MDRVHAGAFVAGTGSFAAEISDWALAAGIEVLGLIELVDEARLGTTVHGLTVVPARPPAGGADAVIGAGGDRRELWEHLAGSGWRPRTLVHPAAALARDAELGAGATVGPGAVVGAAARIGAHAIVSRGALVGHHVEVGAFATLNPGVNVGGNTRIGERAFVGIGATVVDGVDLGDGAVIAAGAVVLHDVEAGARVQGVPARSFAGTRS